MHDLIWDYCIQMPRRRVLASRVEIKSASQAILSSFETEAGAGRCQLSKQEVERLSSRERRAMTSV